MERLINNLEHRKTFLKDLRKDCRTTALTCGDKFLSSMWFMIADTIGDVLDMIYDAETEAKEQAELEAHNGSKQKV